MANAKKKTRVLVTGDKAVLKRFGSKVREIRMKQGKSVYDLTGDDMPIKSRQHWQSIENGKRNINLTIPLFPARENLTKWLMPMV